MLDWVLNGHFLIGALILFVLQSEIRHVVGGRARGGWGAYSYFSCSC